MKVSGTSGGLRRPARGRACGEPSAAPAPPTSLPDQNEIFELDTAFHRAYVEAGAGARILALHDAVKPQAERYCRLYISALVARITDSVREHGEIIEALRRGAAEATERAVLVNWRNAADRFSEAIVSLGERGTW